MMPRIKQSELTMLEEALIPAKVQATSSTFLIGRLPLSSMMSLVSVSMVRDIELGGSKGKRLRSLIGMEDNATVARVLVALWDHRAAVLARRGREDEPGVADRYFRIVHKLQGDTGMPNANAIERFTQNETLNELVAAIQRDIAVNRPPAALDRLHTYCMKKFSHLIESHGGAYYRDEPLHSRAGKYIKLLETGCQLQPISAWIMKSSISIFEEFNSIRNNKSLACNHLAKTSTSDNPI